MKISFFLHIRYITLSEKKRNHFLRKLVDFFTSWAYNKESIILVEKIRATKCGYFDLFIPLDASWTHLCNFYIDICICLCIWAFSLWILPTVSLLIIIQRSSHREPCRKWRLITSNSEIIKCFFRNLKKKWFFKTRISCELQKIKYWWPLKQLNLHMFRL